MVAYRADRKGWPLTHVSVELKHDRIHAVDSRDCETRPGRIERIERVVNLRGSLSAEQRRRAQRWCAG